MKKYYFIKEYLIAADSQLAMIKAVSTVEVDLLKIEQELPEGAQIKQHTLQTVIEGARFIVYGEYELPLFTGDIVARESIDLDQVLGDEENLPSLN